MTRTLTIAAILAFADAAHVFSGEFEFKGLGSTGGQLEPLLQRDILGYQ